MTRAQTLFVIALAAVAVLIVLFTVYVASSVFWSARWYRRGSGVDGPDGGGR